MIVQFIVNDRANPPGKLAEAELHFDEPGLLSGLKLIGFSVWERRGGSGFNVTFPARQYSVNGERRSFALLRPAGADGLQGQERIRQFIIDAWIAHVEALNVSAVMATMLAEAPPVAEAPFTLDREAERRDAVQPALFKGGE